jgi:hypothetical protein
MRERREPSGLRSRHPVDDEQIAFSLMVVERLLVGRERRPLDKAGGRLDLLKHAERGRGIGTGDGIENRTAPLEAGEEQLQPRGRDRRGV